MNGFLIALFISLIGPAVSWGSGQCAEAHLQRQSIRFPFEKVKAGHRLQYDSVYFAGTPAERDTHAESMGSAGRHALSKLIARYTNSLPRHSPILEIGPFLRPLATPLSNDHRWIIWEYDSQAAQKLADVQRADVYRVDLNALNEEGWKIFLSHMQERSRSSSGLKLSAAIMSSVLNYVDYRIVLDKVVENMADGGIIFIGNSNVGDIKMMLGQTPINGSLILEYLLSTFPEKVSVLPGSHFTLESFDGSRSGISLAVQIHQSSQPLTNQYMVGVGLYTDYVAMPFSIKFPGTKHSKGDLYTQFWNSRESRDIEQARQDIQKEKRKWIPDTPTNRFAEIEFQIEKNRELIDAVLKVKNGTPECEQLQKELLEPKRERFLPERIILIESLRMEAQHRRLFLDQKLRDLYRRMGHSIGAQTGRP